VRHLIVDDAATLNIEILQELHQVALIARTQLWLLKTPPIPAGVHRRPTRRSSPGFTPPAPPVPRTPR